MNPTVTMTDANKESLVEPSSFYSSLQCSTLFVRSQRYILVLMDSGFMTLLIYIVATSR